MVKSLNQVGKLVFDFYFVLEILKRFYSCNY